MAPRLKIRRRSRAAGSLTAAAQRISDPAKSLRKSGNSGRGEDDWQTAAWAMLDKVGELSYYVGWRSASVSRCRLVASDVDPETGDPTGSTENEKVRQIVQGIGGSTAGQAQMLKRLATFLTVPGDGFVAMVVRDPNAQEDESGAVLDRLGPPGVPVEEWLAVSRDELKGKGSDDFTIALPDGTKHKFDKDRDILVRVWNPHPRLSTEADSPVRANLVTLNEIQRASAQIDNASKSRLVGNGIVFVPSEMSLPNQVAPTAAGGTLGTTAPALASAQAQDLQDLIFDVANTAYEDQNSMAALLPIIATVPGEWTKNVTHLKFDSQVSETAIKTRDSAIRRLAMGLDVAPERLLGLGSNSNHWSAWAIGEDDVKVHIAPVLETICEALTREILRGELLDAGLDPDQFVVWYSIEELTQDPDKKDEAKDGYDRGAVNSDALVKHLGFDADDGYDLSTPAGWKAWAIDRVKQDPALITTLAPLIGEVVAAVPAPAATPALDPPTPPEDTTEPDAEPEVEPDSGDTEASQVAAAVSALADTFVCRALELANKRRRTRANADQYRGVPVHLAHRGMDPVEAGDVHRLIEGWDASVPWAVIERLGYNRTTFGLWVIQDVVEELVEGKHHVPA